MLPEIRLAGVTVEDVARVEVWLDDPEVNTSWYGVDENQTPIHIGYSPHSMRSASGEALVSTLEDDSRKIFSIYTSEGDHIGEGQLVIEWPLLEAQLFLLIGRKDLWHHHYGSAALIRLLDHAYDGCNLHRVWVDVPEYNENALTMCQHLGFILEGHLRGTHRKNGEWYDSLALGLLVEEYYRRRERLLGSQIS